MNKEKVSILVDVQNVYYTTRQAFNKSCNYNALWAEISKNRNIINANAYAIEPNNDKQKQFQNILRAIGFTVCLKPYIQRSDGSAKGDWDVGITLDAMEFAAQSDVIILVSGDGDFDLLVQRMKKKYGVRVEVYGVRALTADSLIRSADSFFPLSNDLLQ